MTRVIWSGPALRQVEAIRDYIAQFNPGAALGIAQELIAAGNALSFFPHRGRPVPGTDKRELVTAFPYVIRYRIASDTVRILRVRHTARRPTNP